MGHDGFSFLALQGPRQKSNVHRLFAGKIHFHNSDNLALGGGSPLSTDFQTRFQVDQNE